MKSALEGVALAMVLAGVAYVAVRPELFRFVATGLGSAWGASTVSVVLLVLGRSVSFTAFMWTFGWGVALRGFVLAALMAWVWGDLYERQAAVLVAYVVGILVLSLLQYRHIGRIEK